MTKEIKIMTLLKVENDKGFYLSSDNSYKELDQIGKDDLLFLINKILDENECQMESLEDKSLKNQAHNIIYRNIYTKLNSFFNRRNEFNDQINQIYKEEYEKYKV